MTENHNEVRAAAIFVSEKKQKKNIVVLEAKQAGVMSAFSKNKKTGRGFGGGQKGGSFGAGGG